VQDILYNMQPGQWGKSDYGLDVTQYHRITVNFLGIIALWLYRRIHILRKYTMKYLEVKCQDVCNFQIVREKSVCVCVEKERRVHTHR